MGHERRAGSIQPREPFEQAGMAQRTSRGVLDRVLGLNRLIAGIETEGQTNTETGTFRRFGQSVRDLVNRQRGREGPGERNVANAIQTDAAHADNSLIPQPSHEVRAAITGPAGDDNREADQQRPPEGARQDRSIEAASYGSGPPGEPPVEGPPQPSENEPDPSDPEIQAALMTAVIRHNDMVAIQLPVYENTQFDLKVDDREGLEKLFVTVETPTVSVNPFASKSHFVTRVGHYDPALEQFNMYSEMLTTEEAEIVAPLAEQRRRQAVQGGDLWWDYDAEIVRALRREHRDVLLEDGLVYKIVKSLNTQASDRGIRDEVFIDDSTSFYVCLERNLDKPEEPYVSLQLHGHRNTESGAGHKNRRSSRIHLAECAPTGEYIPYGGLVTNGELGRVLALITELQQLKASAYPSLDTERVVLRK